MEERQGPRVSPGHFGLQRREGRRRRESNQCVRRNQGQGQRVQAVEGGENGDSAPDLATWRLGSNLARAGPVHGVLGGSLGNLARSGQSSQGLYPAVCLWSGAERWGTA